MLFDLRSRGRRRTVRPCTWAWRCSWAAASSCSASARAAARRPAQRVHRQRLQQPERLDQPGGEGRCTADRDRTPTTPRRGPRCSTPATRTPPATASTATTNTYTAAGKQELTSAAQAWQRYLALTKNPITTSRSSPPTPTPPSASTPTRPTRGRTPPRPIPTSPKSYECLAISAYAAKQNRKGDLAAAKAARLVPKASRKTLAAADQHGQDAPRARPDLLTASQSSRANIASTEGR